MQKRAALLARTSGKTGNQEDSIDTQVQVLQEFAASLGYSVAEDAFYLDAGCQSHVPVHERPHGHRLLEDCRAGKIDCVLIYRIDRLSRYRDVFYQFLRQLKELNVGLRSRYDQFETDSPQGKLHLDVVLSFSEFERNSIVQRSMDGRIRTAELGGHLGAMPPYAFRIEGRKPKFLAIDEEEATVLRLIFSLAVDQRMSPRHIAAYLNAAGIPPPGASPARYRRGKPHYGRWELTTVSKLLRDDLYIGVRRYCIKGKEIVQQVPQIIPTETFEAARQLTLERRLHHNPSKRAYLLKGKVRCGACGHAWSGQTCINSYTREDGTKAGNRGYYTCIAALCPHACAAKEKCTMKRVKQGLLEDQAWQVIVDHLWNIPETMLKLEQAKGAEEGRMEQLRQRRDTVLARQTELAVQQKRVRRLMASGAFTEEDGKETLAEIRRELDEVQDTLSALAREEELLLRQDAQLARVEQRLQEWRRKLSGPITWDDKRAAIEDFVQCIEIMPTDEGVKAHYHLVFDAPAIRIDTDSVRTA